MASSASARRSRSPRASQLPVLPAPPTGAALTREKLLQAAHELLFEQTGVEPSVAQICQRAGVQMAMVSYCFGGKAQLFEALAERAAAAIVSELEQLAALDLEPEETLRRHVRGMVRNFVRFPYAKQVLARVRAGDRRAARTAAIFTDPALAFYRNLFAKGAARRKFRDVDATLFMFSIVGMCEFLFTAQAFFESTGATLDDAVIESYSEHAAELLLRGITSRK